MESIDCFNILPEMEQKTVGLLIVSIRFIEEHNSEFLSTAAIKTRMTVIIIGKKVS